MISAQNIQPVVNVISKRKSFGGELIFPQKKFYEDKYALVSFVESIPCIKLKFNGVPTSSEHYESVQNKIIEFVRSGTKNYCRLHLLTDNSKAGLVLDEDMNYYQTTVIPAMEEAGIRYHAMVLPESLLVRLVMQEIDLSAKKMKLRFFNTVRDASGWLRTC